MLDVAVRESLIVAVGHRGHRSEQDASVWVSPDGLSWRGVNDSVFGGDGHQGMNGVASGDSLWVAVGHDGHFNSSLTGSSVVGSQSSAVWTSSDGVSWQRVPHEEALFGDSGMTDVVAFSGGFVAVGVTELIPGEHTAAVWFSENGTQWSLVFEDNASGTALEAVAAGESGLVAVGVWGPDYPQTAVVLTSPDGQVWSRVPADSITTSGLIHGEPDDADAEAGGMFDVTPVGTGYLAVGATGQSAFGRAIVWHSDDGSRWRRVFFSDNGYGYMASIASGESGLVAVGQSEDGAVVWVNLTE